MSKFERALSADELQTIAEELMWSSGESIGFGIDVANAVQDAVLTKLTEQEPIAWFIDDKRACGNGIITDLAIAKDWLETNPDKVTPLYAHPMPSSQVNLDSSNAPFTPKTASEMRSFIRMHFDSLQYANPETEEPDEMDRYTLTIHDLLSAFDWAGHYDCDHISDDGKMVGLSLSVDTKEAQALLQSYLDSIDGWQLVPKEIDPTLLAPFVECPIDELPLAWRTLLMIAPNHTGDSNE